MTKLVIIKTKHLQSTDTKFWFSANSIHHYGGMALRSTIFSVGNNTDTFLESTIQQTNLSL